MLSLDFPTYWFCQGFKSGAERIKNKLQCWAIMRRKVVYAKHSVTTAWQQLDNGLSPANGSDWLIVSTFAAFIGSRNSRQENVCCVCLSRTAETQQKAFTWKQREAWATTAETTAPSLTVTVIKVSACTVIMTIQTTNQWITFNT